ncbi:hypothetical protein BDZ45DRAFT_741029 [Acephala macrosclerotiorum]|nr:hypothetical protein BDZ45DRAFT_741029 [Acephala macrosclerotiorum]
MAPADWQGFLAKRQNTVNNNNGDYCDVFGCYSTWDNWGRWVALAVIIVAIIIIAFLFSCFNNRRRRQRGVAPMYGTGWIPYGKPPLGHQQAYYNPNGDNYHPPPPPYQGTQATGTTFNSNEGYYGHHGQNVYPQQEYGTGANDIELQQPQSSYMPQRGGDPVYDAPQVPLPKKGDGVIR